METIEKLARIQGCYMLEQDVVHWLRLNRVHTGETASDCVNRLVTKELEPVFGNKNPKPAA